MGWSLALAPSLGQFSVSLLHFFFSNPPLVPSPVSECVFEKAFYPHFLETIDNITRDFKQTNKLDPNCSFANCFCMPRYHLAFAKLVDPAGESRKPLGMAFSLFPFLFLFLIFLSCLFYWILSVFPLSFSGFWSGSLLPLSSSSSPCSTSLFHVLLDLTPIFVFALTCFFPLLLPSRLLRSPQSLKVAAHSYKASSVLSP